MWILRAGVHKTKNLDHTITEHTHQNAQLPVIDIVGWVPVFASLMVANHDIGM